MSKPHVVGVVGNDIVNDSRVKKAAASMAAANYRSTILCYTTGSRRVSKMGEVTVVRVPVPFHVRNRYGRVPSPTRPFAAKELADRHLGPRAALLARKRRLEAEIAVGDGRPIRLFLTSVWLWIRRKIYVVRVRAHVTIDRGLRRLYLIRTRIGHKLLRLFRNPVGHLLDYELAFGPELEALEPDVIHAHDYHMIGVAVNAARMLRRKGHDTKVIYDAHELVEGLSYEAATIRGWLAEEAAYIDAVDRVIGVSPEQLARIQQRYGLVEQPLAVLNAPLVGPADERGPTLRDEIPEGRILVYHGNIARERGVFTLVEALTHMADDVHVAIVAPPDSPFRPEIEEHAAALGLVDRVHILDFVPSEQLPGFLRSGDLAVIPYAITGNNDIALPNKLFESIQSDLPILTSNMRALSRYVTEHEIGLVFESGDARDLAAKATKILADRDTYAQRLTPALKREAGWDAHAATLVGVCDSLLGVDRSGAGTIRVTPADIVESDLHEAWVSYRSRRLAVGPRNMAGQAHRIARAVQGHLGIEAVSFVLDNGKFDFPADHRISREWWFDPEWQTHQIRLLASTCTHVLTESGTGLYGALGGGFVDEQLAQMRADRLEVAVLLHGSEIRDPRRHREMPFSPYATGDPLIRDLEVATARLRRHLGGLDVPFFVTTPDLQADIEALWLPVVVDLDSWSGLRSSFQSDRPTVLHLPSNGLLKGSDYVDEVLFALEGEGLINYLRPTEPMQPDEVPALVEQADIVVDGIVLGAYGVMSCQAMAAGRIAVANTRDLGALRSACPIVDASPSNLDDVLRELISERDDLSSIVEAGRSFVAEYHDGAYTARQLAGFLGA